MLSSIHKAFPCLCHEGVLDYGVDIMLKPFWVATAIAVTKMRIIKPKRIIKVFISKGFQ
jgi:hypothetical protein